MKKRGAVLFGEDTYIFLVLLVFLFIFLFYYFNYQKQFYNDDVYSSPDVFYSYIDFAIILENGTLIEYLNPLWNFNTKEYYSDENINATLSYMGNGFWNLTLENKGSQKIEKVLFPYDKTGSLLNSDTSDDVLYYPYKSGVAFKATSIENLGWFPDNEVYYPGECCSSPFVILADTSKAKIVAATNWPPKKVLPRYNSNKMILIYKESILPTEIKNYISLVKIVNGNSQEGNYGWQNAVDEYKYWLNTKIEESGLNYSYTGEMENSDGFFNVRLQNIENFSIINLENQWSNWRDYFPWIIYFGQMSGYNESCCVYNRTLHNRYAALETYSNLKVSEGFKVGYYQRPLKLEENSSYFLLDNSTTYSYWDANEENSSSYLSEWIRRTKDIYGGNLCYIGAFGSAYLGKPFFVASFLNNSAPKDSIIEQGVDIYPSSYLISGNIFGGSVAGSNLFNFTGEPEPAVNSKNLDHSIRTPESLGSEILVKNIKIEYYKTGLLNEFVIPNFSLYSPDLIVYQGRIDFSAKPQLNYNDHFGVKAIGKFRVPFNASYNLTLGYYPGMQLIYEIMIDGKKLDTTGEYNLSGSIYTTNFTFIEQGIHDLELRFYINDSLISPNVEFKQQANDNVGINNITEKIIDENYLFHKEIFNSMSFPELSRYVLNDRIFFMGDSNGDDRYWGYGYDRNYYAERRGFLLGVKFDAGNINDSAPFGQEDIMIDSSKMNPILKLAIEERNRTGWWSREPLFNGKRGIYDNYGKMELTNFIDKDGKILIVIDNWNEESLINISYGGEIINQVIPIDVETGKPKRLFIFEILGQECPDADGDGFRSCTSNVAGGPIDCIDTNSEINPIASELCDGEDNNCNFQTDEGCVESSPSNDGGGGGSIETDAKWTKTISWDRKNMEEIKNIYEKLNLKSRVKIKINNEIHYVGILDMTEYNTTIEVLSEPQVAVLNIGESKSFDLNNYLGNDLAIELERIVGNYAHIKISYIGENIVKANNLSETENSSKLKPEEKDIEDGSSNKLSLIIIILMLLIVCAIIIVYIFRFRKIKLNSQLNSLPVESKSLEKS